MRPEAASWGSTACRRRSRSSPAVSCCATGNSRAPASATPTGSSPTRPPQLRRPHQPPLRQRKAKNRRAPSVEALRAHIESVYHHVGSAVRRHLDLQLVRTGGQPIRPEDGGLESLDRIAPEELDLLHESAVEENLGRPAGARLLAADPAHRGSGESEGDGRVLLIARGG